MLVFLAIGAAIAVAVAWFAVLFTGKYPRGLFDLVEGVFRWDCESRQMPSSSSPMNTRRSGCADFDQRRAAPANHPRVRHDDGVALAVVRHASARSREFGLRAGCTRGLQLRVVE